MQSQFHHGVNMSKRLFRKKPKKDEPAYPTLDTFDQGRRSFLLRLGAAALGAGTMASLAACGNRAVKNLPDGGAEPDGEVWIDPPDGVAPLPDARIDPDMTIEGGVAPMPDAKIDTKPPEPDGWITMGEPPMPDAKIDTKPDPPAPGYAPVMDARIDDSGKGCPNP
jgi:hypothetical protein